MTVILVVDTEHLRRQAGASAFGIPEQDERDHIREAADEIDRLRIVAAFYAAEPCQYLNSNEGSDCTDVDLNFPEEYCGPCLARAALREH